MVSKNEIEEAKIALQEKKMAAKSLKDVDGIGETIAFIWAFRQKEFKNIIIVVQLAINIILLGLYTPIFGAIFKKIMGVFIK